MTGRGRQSVRQFARERERDKEREEGRVRQVDTRRVRKRQRESKTGERELENWGERGGQRETG